jgi:hypothetical protein
MIWIELVACIVIALECLLFLLYHIQPSFYFFMSICMFHSHLTCTKCRFEPRWMGILIL